MRVTAIRIALLIALSCAVWGVRAFGGAADRQAPIAEAAASALAAGPSAAQEGADVRETVRFLEARVRSDPEDANANNKLAGYHLQLLRETGSIGDLEAALQAAHASLASVPVVRNADGVTALALGQFASHDFVGARDRARELIRFDPSKSYPYAILGDALVELGAYDEAARAYREMTRHSDGVDTNGEPRLARLAFLRGDSAGAARHFTNALAVAIRVAVPPRETIAWCQWQLGETAFAQGRYEAAEQYDRDALASFPSYFRALGSLGRVRAARGDVRDAMAQYEAAIRRFPDPTYVAALGDLDKVAGRNDDAAAQYALVEAIGHLSAVNGVLYNRQLALFYADHDVKTGVAYENAKREYAVRRDVYGADAVAWTALKAGRLAEARTAARDALRLGTGDARLLFHAGMIARAAGDEPAARDYLQRALALNPQFDPLQAPVARAALARALSALLPVARLHEVGSRARVRRAHRVDRGVERFARRQRALAAPPAGPMAAVKIVAFDRMQAGTQHERGHDPKVAHRYGNVQMIERSVSVEGDSGRYGIVRSAAENALRSFRSAKASSMNHHAMIA